MLTTVIETFLIPPGLSLLLFFIAFMLWKIHWGLSRLSLTTAFFSLWLLSTPIGSSYLLKWLETPYPAYTPEFIPPGVEAIVVLGGGRHSPADEYNGDTVSHHTLWRLRYAAYLAQQWNVPVIISGGVVEASASVSEAELSRQFLQDELNVATVWTEDESHNTWENAQRTKALLEKQNVSRVALVTHGYHMRRSAYSFTQVGIDFIPMSTGLMHHLSNDSLLRNWLPSAHSMSSSRMALHEYLGLLFYRFK